MPRQGEPLSERELEIAELVAKGFSNREIARELFISVNTVKVHLKNIFIKLDVQSRTQLARRAMMEEGWLLAGDGAESIGVEGATVVTEVTEAGRGYLGWRIASILGLALAFIGLLLLPRIDIQMRETGQELTVVPESVTIAESSPQIRRWSGLAPMSTARSGLAVVAYEGRIYAFGGETQSGVTGLLEVYDPLSDTWKTATPKRAPARDISGTVLQGKIYLPGGCTTAGEPLSIMEVYDPRSDSWEDATPLPQALCAYALAAWEGQLYLFGGWDGSSYSAATYRYDPGVDIWQEGTPLSSPRGYAGAATLGDKIYVVGGYDGEEILKTVEEYDPVLEAEGIDPWRSKADMSMGRAGLGVVALGGNLYAIGGGWDHPVEYNERYDPGLDSWFPFEASPVNAWSRSGVAAIDTTIYLFGGWKGGHTASAEAYQALFRIFIPAWEWLESPE